MDDFFELLSDEDITIIDKDHKIIQKKEGFRFSIDAVLLTNFFLPKKKGKILDIGTGNGIIPVLLLLKNKDYDITGIEIQSDIAILAKKNLEINKFGHNVKIINEDVKKYSMGNQFDYIISNPPYMTVDGKMQNSNNLKKIGRHEIFLDLENFILNSKRLLKPVGSITFVHRSRRLQEIVSLLTKYSFDISRLQFVHYNRERESNLVLIEAIKGKKLAITIEAPIFLKE
ncbi:tRNA1(Val) (adenine(37)-N6)-methyltransferase [Fusobacterium sp. PH5-44]|uniref:tRNA1(Val) (adenine(37)-N6)-methyltransferase n=1 Tax=unclassified Fusobacterium TaxID=2648384 RepID=UPI003D21DD91